MRQRTNHSRAGFIMTDLVIGLGLVTMVGLLLSGAVGRAHATEQRMADQRAAARVAERAMLDLQHRQPVPSLGDDVRIIVRPVASDGAPAGFRWTAIDATVRGRHATLIGLVATDAGGGTP